MTSSNPTHVDAVAAPAFCLVEALHPGPAAWHDHDRHQLLYAAEGSLRFETEAAVWLLPPERAAWIPAHTRHRAAARERATLHTVYLAADFVADAAVPTRPGAVAVFAVDPLAHELLDYAARFTADIAPDDPVAGRFFAALVDFAASWTARPLPVRLPNPRSERLQRVVAWCLDNLDVADLDRAAGVAHYSPHHLSRRFAAETGMSWQRFITAARMVAAMELLADPDRSITDVALAVGYQSSAAFTYAFGRYVGMSPRQWRAS